MSDAQSIRRSASQPRRAVRQGIDPCERKWMKLTVALLVGFFVAVTVAGFAAGFQLPGADSRVDPRTVSTRDRGRHPASSTSGTASSRPTSSRRCGASRHARSWSRSGPRSTIYVTSSDLQHGLKITDTNVNVMVVPGQVSKLTYTFEEVGEFPYICHEYCGPGTPRCSAPSGSCPRRTTPPSPRVALTPRRGARPTAPPRRATNDHHGAHDNGCGLQPVRAHPLGTRFVGGHVFVAIIALAIGSLMGPLQSLEYSGSTSTSTSSRCCRATTRA